MMASTKMPVARACLLAAAAGTAVYSVSASFLNGLEGAHGLAAYALATAGASVTFGSWFILPEAAKVAQDGHRTEAWLYRLGWLLCTVFVLWNATGFTALHRTEKVGTAQNGIEAYDRASQGLKSASSDLEDAKKAKKWASTKGCTVALTLADSKTFCGNVTVIRSNIATYENILKAGRPGSSDAQAETIGFWLHLNPELVGKFSPVLWALILEIAMSLFLLIALRPERREEAAAAAVTVEAPATAAPDLSPLLEALQAAQDEVAAARAAFDAALATVPFLHFEKVLAEAADLFVEPEADVIGYTAPVTAPEATFIPEVAAAVAAPAEVKKAERGVAKAGKVRKQVRDAHGRYAKKAKLVSVTRTPQVKPQLSAVPLGGQENVVIFGTHPKKD